MAGKELMHQIPGPNMEQSIQWFLTNFDTLRASVYFVSRPAYDDVVSQLKQFFKEMDITA